MQRLGTRTSLCLSLLTAAACGSDAARRPTPTGVAAGGSTAEEMPSTSATPSPNLGTTETLREIATPMERHVGVALSANRLNNAGYANAALEFNYVTPENEL